MTPTKALCQAAGLDIKTAADKARMCPRYLAHCINNGCSYETAARLSLTLNCDMMIFMWGYREWQRRNKLGHTGDAVGSKPVDPLPVLQRDRQRHILKLV